MNFTEILSKVFNMASSSTYMRNRSQHWSLLGPFGSHLGKDMVTITVGAAIEGEMAQEFLVHQKILCQKVPFFNAMFNGGFQETTTKTCSLEEDDTETFSLFLGWLYQDTIKFNSSDYAEPRLTIIRLNAFAIKYNIPSLADKSIDTLIGQGNPFIVSSSEVTMAYALSPEKSKIQHYYARATAAYLTHLQNNSDGRNSEDRKRREDKVYDALMGQPDVMREVLSVLGSYPNDVVNSGLRSVESRCDFHMHGKTEDCWARKKY